jgi:hypothetical protein
MQELLLSVTALAQISYFDSQFLSTASTAFTAAVAASADIGVSSTSKSSGHVQEHQQQQPLQPPQQQQQQQQQGLLSGIRDDQLIINYLWANASLAHSDPLLLRAAVQLLLSRVLVCDISRSHLPLCMWSLAALLVCDQQQQQQRQQQQQQQQEGDLIHAVVAVHNVLAQQAQQMWLEASKATSYQQQHSSNSKQEHQPAHTFSNDTTSDSSSDSSSSSTGTSKSRRSRGAHSSSRQEPSQKGSARLRVPFSIDSRRQMYQAHVWLQAAATAAPDADSRTRYANDAHTQAAVPPVTTGLSSPAELLATAQQQQQQQAAAAGSVSEEGFWRYCAAAWSNNTSQVSGLQRQVFQVSSSTELCYSSAE